MNWTSYLIQMNLYLAFFYAFYWLFLRKETFFNLNRTYLLSSALFSVLIPLIKAGWINSLFVTEKIQQNWTNVTVIMMEGYAIPIKENWVLGDYLALIYCSVAFVLFIKLIYKFIKVNRLLKNENPSEAFSFFKKIRINKNLPQQLAIQKHELTHVQHLHSVDVILFELLGILNWFNPVIYLYKTAIKHIHEFIADEKVLQDQTDKQQYALLLLSERFGVNPHTLTNNFFNQSILKRRIEMMNKTKSRKVAILKYGLSAPLFLLAVVLSSAKISENETLNNIAEKVQPKKQISEILIPRVIENLLQEKQSEKLVSINYQEKEASKIDVLSSKDSIPSGSSITDVVVKNLELKDTLANSKIIFNPDVYPNFPGGMDAFTKFVSNNLKYPEEAKGNGIQGKVVVSYIVELDGSLSNLKVQYGIGAGCDEEAVRIMAISPKWNPAIKNGKSVRVHYYTPISFDLGYKTGNMGFDDNSQVGISSKGNSVVEFKKVISKTHRFESNNNGEIHTYEVYDRDKLLLVVDEKIIGVAEISDKYIKAKEISGGHQIKIEPNEILKMKVLKGEVAIAKYGDKGKNGVIEITSKK